MRNKWWRDDAACIDIDPEVWYDDPRSDRFKTALRACRDCPVRAQCLVAGMDERDGIWGGLTGNQRRKLAREHAARLVPA